MVHFFDFFLNMGNWKLKMNFMKHPNSNYNGLVHVVQVN